MTMFDRLRSMSAAVVEEKRRFRKRMEDEGIVVMKDALHEFLDAHPEVENVMWTQYTPYFNDGDACVFGVNEAEVSFVKERPDGHVYDDDDDEREYHNEWSSSVSERLKDDLHELNRNLQSMDEALEIIFGDHVKVVATRNEVVASEYEHD